MAFRGATSAGLLFLAGELWAAAGCAVGPDYQRPEVPVNREWSAKADPRITAQAPADAAWWKAFNDPTLDRLIDLAHHDSPPLQIAGLRILEARARLGIAFAQQFPVNPGPIASATGGGLRGSDLTLHYGEYQVGFDAAWEPDFWGKYRRGVRAARAGYFATVADYQDAVVALAAEVARTYFVVRTFQVLVALARQNVGVQEEGLRIAEARMKNGATSGLDVAQATNLLESTRTTIPELQVGLAQAENALCALLGRTPGCGPSLLTGAEAIPPAPALVAVSVPAELLRRRPDIRSAELNAIAQCDRIGVAKAELYPSFVLSGALGTRTVATTGAPSPLSSLVGLFNPGTLLYSLGASLFWPILSYPRIMNNVRVEDARFQQALLAWRDLVLRAAREVEDGLAGFLREQETVAFAQSAAAAAQDAVNLALVQYREGAVDYQRVLDSERALLQSQNTLARARSSVVTNLVALYKALGGGWEVRRDQPAVPDAIRDEMQRRTNWGSYFSKPEPPPKKWPPR